MYVYSKTLNVKKLCRNICYIIFPFSIKKRMMRQSIKRLGNIKRVYRWQVHLIFYTQYSFLFLFHSLFLLRMCTRLCLWKTHKCLHAFVGIVNAWRCVTSGPRCEVLSRATTARRYLIWTSCKPRQWLSINLLITLLFLFVSCTSSFVSCVIITENDIQLP